MEKNVFGFGEDGEIEFRQAGTEAELRITADCSSVQPHYCKTPC